MSPTTVKAHRIAHAEFVVSGCLFDMDGTLVDSIGAVEEAWGSVATELGKDPQEVIDATHGRRAIDNLRELKPELSGLDEREMDPHVKNFEEKILESADAFQKEVRSRRQSAASSRRASRSGTPLDSPSQPGSKASSRAPSRSGSMSHGKSGGLRKNSSFAADLSKRMLGMSITQMPPSRKPESPADSAVVMDSGVTSPRSLDYHEDVFEDEEEDIDIDSIEVETGDLTDNSVRILPGVRKLIDSIPHGKWCVATSGAKTYCHGALKRVGIELPPVVVTADHPELKHGKPHPAPFLLAAEKMGLHAKDCCVFEDSPSGIRAGVASGAAVIAVATSHPIEKIENCGATYLVPTLECVKVEPMPNGLLKITISPPPSASSE